MYENPSIRMELVRHQHAELILEAKRAQLASRAHAPSHRFALVDGVVAGARRLLAWRPVPVQPARLQPST